jgi:hypothetical protein
MYHPSIYSGVTTEFCKQKRATSNHTVTDRLEAALNIIREKLSLALKFEQIFLPT